MKPIIRLQDFIQEMNVFSDEYRAFLNIQTGEFVTLSDEELGAAEEGESLEDFPEWQRESIQKAGEVLFSDDYRELPSKFDIHEYSIMERFCYSVEDDKLRRRLLNSIRGRGAFRYFKDTIHEYGIVDDWYEYRERAFKRIAIEWLESHNIAYTDEEAEDGV
ncbi:MAG: UPF0158 family protein [Anaerolineales bacterium]|jgi:hypothetical protein